MNTTEKLALADKLERHNKWRRGDDSIEPTVPKELGVALEQAINFLRAEAIDKLAAAGGEQSQDAEQAAMYRWLRTRSEEIHDAKVDCCVWQGFDLGSGVSLRFEKLDEAIRAAMRVEG